MKRESDKKREFLQICTLVLAVITIPLHNNINSWAILLFCVTAFFTTPFRDSLKRLRKYRYWILTAVFFAWLGATYFWDTSGGFSIKYWECYGLFIVLPFIFTILPRIPSSTIQIACYAFVGSVIAVSTICLIRSFLEYLQTHDERVFYYHYLGYQMNLNAIYLSNYCIAALSWLLYFQFLYRGKKTIQISTWLVILCCIYLFVIVFLLSSKLSIPIMLAELIFFSIYIGYQKKAMLKSLVVIVLFMAAAVVLAKNLFYLKWRLDASIFKEYSGPVDNQNDLAVHLFVWHSAVELIGRKPLLGYGLKGAQDELMKKYEAGHFYAGIPERYNSHNQFMETTLRSGLIGLALLVSVILVPFIKACRQKKLLLILMLFHFGGVSMVEGTLEIQQELVFYWLFIFLFYFHYLKTRKSSVRSSPDPETGSLIYT